MCPLHELAKNSWLWELVQKSQRECVTVFLRWTHCKYMEKRKYRAGFWLNWNLKILLIFSEPISFIPIFGSCISIVNPKHVIKDKKISRLWEWIYFWHHPGGIYSYLLYIRLVSVNNMNCKWFVTIGGSVFNRRMTSSGAKKHLTTEITKD